MYREQNIKTYFEDYRTRLNNLLDKVDLVELTKVVDAFITAFKNNKTIYICGNGGSAATASHMQADFCFFTRYFSEFKPKVRALTDNIPLITAISNDMSYDLVFVEQLKGNFEKGDVLVCISASGNSGNVIKAAEYIKDKEGTSIGFIGFTGGRLLELCDISLYTENPKGDYGPIEDLHMLYDHLIVNYLSTDGEFLKIPSK